MKISIIGYGGMGSYHASRLKNNGILEVKGVYDIDLARQEVAKKEGYIAYPSYHAVADDGEINGVLIATPNDLHRFYVAYFSRAGIHTICEKPATMTSNDFTVMANESKRAYLWFIKTADGTKTFLSLRIFTITPLSGMFTASNLELWEVTACPVAGASISKTVAV